MLTVEVEVEVDRSSGESLDLSRVSGTYTGNLRVDLKFYFRQHLINRFSQRID